MTLCAVYCGLVAPTATFLWRLGVGCATRRSAAG